VEFDRVVQVRAVLADGRLSFGTGYLIAARLVLTSGHVLADGPGSRAEVTCPDAGPGGFMALVRWRRVSDAVDAALAEIDDPGWVPPLSWSGSHGFQRFGELVTTVSGQPANARGFPRLQRESGGRFDEQVHGRISPGAGDLAGRYEIVSDDPLPAPAGDGRPQWAGMSGAAVFCGALLTGVIRADRGASHGARLIATRARDILDDAEAAALITAHSTRAALIEPVELAGILDAAAVSRDLRSPAMLLRAEAEAVSFRGRAIERQALLEWITEDSADPPVLVLTGPGGQGKSRLSRWLLEAARRQGHHAGQIAPGTDGDRAGDLPDLAAFAWVRGPVLAVVDYAESRPALVRRLIELSRDGGGRVRLLLLARASGAWKTDPMGASAVVHEILAGAPEMKLGPLDNTTAGQEDAFAAAVQDLARLLGEVRGYQDANWLTLAESVPVPSALDSEHHQTALSVQMAALAGLLQIGPGKLPSDPHESVETILLRHEERYWDRTARAQYLGTLPTVVLRQAVAACCLCGAATQDQAEATLARLGYLAPDKVLAAALWLHQLYPAPPGRFLGSLQPDRVAEAHASTLVTESPGLLGKLLADAADEQQVQAITVLSRAATGDASVGRPAASQATLDRLTETLDEIQPGPPVLQAVNAALPRYSPVLAGLAARLAEDTVAQYRQLAVASPGVYDVALAAALQNLSLRHTDASQPTQALNAIDEAVTIRRQQAAADLDQWSKLHIALQHQAKCCNTLGLLARAREAEQEGADGPPAAWHSSMDGSSGLPVPIDVVSHGIGIIVPDTDVGARNFFLYSPQSPAGYRRGLAWETTQDNQPALEISLTEGNEEDPEFVKVFVNLRAELPPGLPAGYPVDVEIGYSRDSLISVQAFDGYSGEPLLRPTLKRPRNLTEEEVRKATEAMRRQSFGEAAAVLPGGLEIPADRDVTADTAARPADHYAVLGIGWTASPAEIETAVSLQQRKWNRRANSRRAPARESARRELARIAEAARTLLDPAQRASYDCEIMRHTNVGDASGNMLPVSPAPALPSLDRFDSVAAESLRYAAAMCPPGQPLDTLQVFLAVARVHAHGRWDRIWLYCGRTDQDIADQTAIADPRNEPRERWRSVELTATCAQALRVAADISNRYNMPIAPGVLVLGMLSDPASAATRALSAGADISHNNLLHLAEEELLGTSGPASLPTAVKATTDRIFGIDLGITNSVIAYTDPMGTTEVIAGQDGNRIVPSMVYFGKDGSLLVGTSARQRAFIEPERVAMLFKRGMGEKTFLDDEQPFVVDGKTWSPEELSASVLKKLALMAEDRFGEPVRKVVITVPAYFGDNERAATKSAGEIAGLEVMHIVNEATAAAIAHGLDTASTGRILVFDLGGGTFDVTVMEVAPDGSMKVLATGGDRRLGGMDFDNRILGKMYAAARQGGLDIETEPWARQDAHAKAETLKKELSTLESATTSLTICGRPLAFELTRAEFEQLIKDQMIATEDTILYVLETAGLQPSDIGTVLMVGGSSRIPTFQKMLERVFGKPPVFSRNLDEDVARGAAMLGASKPGALDPQSMRETTSAPPQGAAKTGVKERRSQDRRSTWQTTSTLPRGASYEQLLEFFGAAQGKVEALDDNIRRKRRRWNARSNSPNPVGRQKAAEVLDLTHRISEAIKRGAVDDRGGVAETEMPAPAFETLEELQQILSEYAFANEYDEAIKVAREAVSRWNNADTAAALAWTVSSLVNNAEFAHPQIVAEGLDAAQLAVHEQPGEIRNWESVTHLLLASSKIEDAVAAIDHAEQATDGRATAMLYLLRTKAMVTLQRTDEAMMAAVRAVTRADADMAAAIRFEVTDILISWAASMLPIKSGVDLTRYTEIVGVAAWCSHGVPEAEDKVRRYQM
jgi:molecular chaperone DnaK (HSP70)